MEQHVAATIAAKLKEAMSGIDEAHDYIAKNVKLEERAPLTRAIAEVFAIVNDEIYSRLVKADPGLHEVLFRGLPRDAPDHFLQMSQLRSSADRKD